MGPGVRMQQCAGSSHSPVMGQTSIDPSQEHDLQVRPEGEVVSGHSTLVTTSVHGSTQFPSILTSGRMQQGPTMQESGAFGTPPVGQ